MDKTTGKQPSPKSSRKSRTKTLSKDNVNNTKESNADHPEPMSPGQQSINSAATQSSSRESSPYHRIRSATPDKKNKTDQSKDTSLQPQSKFTESNEARQLRHQTLKMLADDSIALGKLNYVDS